MTLLMLILVTGVQLCDGQLPLGDCFLWLHRVSAIAFAVVELQGGSLPIRV